MNPYLAGTLLGIVLLLAMVVSGRGLGASGGIKYCVVSVVNTVSPSHIENSVHYSKYFEDGKKPITNWLTLEIFGIVAGGFISGALSGRLKLKVERSPGISVARRLIICISGRSALCVRRTTGKGMYKRRCPLRHGSVINSRLRDNDRHIWLCICFCMVLQKKLDIGKGTMAQWLKD